MHTLATLSGPKRWTLRAMWGNTYPVVPCNTRQATLDSLCNGGLIARVERVERHSDGVTCTLLGYMLTRRGERVAEGDV